METMKRYLKDIFEFCKQYPLEAILLFIAGWCIGIIIL